MTDIVEELRYNSALPICPFDKRSPEYWTTPNDKPCKFCGSEPEGPDKCTGADMRIMIKAAVEIERLRLSLSEARAIGKREGMEAMIGALSDDALAKRAADFLLERDQQTTQDERDDGERETSAFIILQMGAAAIRAAMEK